MTSPLGLSCVTAPAKVWHGVLTLSQELRLLPERAETKTRLARPQAGDAAPMERTETQRHAKRRRAFMKSSFEEAEVFEGEFYTASYIRHVFEPARPAVRTRAYIGENGMI